MILILNAHPSSESLCSSIAQTYFDEALQQGHSVSQLNLHSLQFDLNLHEGYQKIQPLEPDLEMAWKLIQDAQHIVLIYPTWWGTMPALLKGFFDRVFLPGKAFKYRKDSPWWDKLLAGKTAHVITTMDTPPWYFRIIYRNAGVTTIRKNILEFCGIKVRKITLLGPVRNASQSQLDKWITQIKAFAKSGV